MIQKILGISLAASFVFFGPLVAADPAADQLTEDLFTIPDWNVATTLSSAAGYRDNIGLSSSRTDGSTFFQAGAEVMIMRIPEGNFEGYTFVDVTETRYLSANTTDHERTAFLTSEARWQTPKKVRLSLQAQVYHHDQVFDVSTTEVSIDSAVLKLTGAALSPAVRWEFAPAWWIEARGTGRKDHYADNLDGYDEGETSLRVGRTWASGTELSFTGAQRWRSHDSREQYTAAGRPLTGTLLKIQKRELSANYTIILDQAKRWRSTLTASHEENEDNGSGYFNFDRQQLTAAVAWKQEAWEVSGSASASQYSFPVQLIGIGINPENRHKDEYRLTLEAKRRLTAAWSLFVFYETERALSNDDRSRFRINTIYTGLSWSWDNLGLD